MPAHVRRVLDGADVLLALNVRFGETATDGYKLFGLPTMRQKLIHVHGSDRELGKIYQTPMAYHASPAQFAAGLAKLGLDQTPVRRAWRETARAAFEKTFALPPQPGRFDMGKVMAYLRDSLPEDAIITNGAGNFAIWPGRQFLYGPGHRLLGSQAGAMGAGIPAAVAAKVAEPERLVLCFTGDGDFQMTMQELGTAMQAGAQPIVLVHNNGTYGTIRMHQEREFPGRVSGTDVVNPDFTAIGKAYGMYAARVETAEAFIAAFAEARASTTGALIEMIVDKEALTPGLSLSQIRAAALKGG